MIIIDLIHGPNLNRLGERESHLYGSMTLNALNERMQQKASAQKARLLTFQSNHEGALIDYIHEAPKRGVHHIIFNPAAFTHTSIALRDALLSIATPFIEVHITNLSSREQFRQCSYFSDIAQGVISGFGVHGYLLALEAILQSSF
ncbi:MAG: type II 3-dehydroquinate dehydratase [Legionellaceae bacterium]|nr:type II 3-dehydroquinate dehydratase [Legionellaceae bacterium]